MCQIADFGLSKIVWGNSGKTTKAKQQRGWWRRRTTTGGGSNGGAGSEKIEGDDEKAADEDNFLRLTRLVGTPGFMAPESFFCAGQDGPHTTTPKDRSGATDVYSFGILLWMLLAREEPYVNDPRIQRMSRFEFMDAIVQQGLRPPVPEALCSELRGVLEDCWHHEPIRRPRFRAVQERLVAAFLAQGTEVRGEARLNTKLSALIAELSAIQEQRAAGAAAAQAVPEVSGEDSGVMQTVIVNDA